MTPLLPCPTKIDTQQVDFNCGASSQADFILNYFLLNLPKFPQIFSNFLSNSPFPPSPTGRLEQLKSPCPKHARTTTTSLTYKQCHTRDHHGVQCRSKSVPTKSPWYTTIALSQSHKHPCCHHRSDRYLLLK